MLSRSMHFSGSSPSKGRTVRVSGVRINRTRGASVAVLAALVLSQATSQAALAEEIPLAISFTDGTSSTVEYGEYWGFPVSADPNFMFNVYNQGLTSITGTGVPSGYTPDLSLYGGTGYLNAPYDKAPLNAGTYSFVISGSYTDGGDTYSGETSPAASLTIEKAKLGIELRVVADPTNSDSSIVSARFTGRFVDEYQSSFFPSSALSPAGVWHITVTDENGEIATERSVERSAGDDVLATSFYWPDAEPGVQYTASAEFVASGPSAGNFDITGAADFSYTGVETARPTPSSTATGKPDVSLPEAAEFGLPLWAVVLIGVLIIGLAVLVTILSVRASRRSGTPVADRVSE